MQVAYRMDTEAQVEKAVRVNPQGFGVRDKTAGRMP